MLQKILMPSGGQTTDELTLVKWNKQVGEAVKKGDVLFEVETDKAILTVESFAEGKLLQVLFPEGAVVKTGELVALIGNEEDLVKEEETVTELIKEKPAPAAEGAISTPVNKNHIPVNEKIIASPLAKNFARIEKIDIEDVGRFTGARPIKKNDVRKFMEHRNFSHEAAGDEDYYIIQLSAMRRTIARRMKESLSTAPHYIVAMDIDMGAAIALRAKINSMPANPVKLSFNDIVMKAAALAVRQVPVINSRFEENGIKVFKQVNIGLAVATGTGIIVPVTHGVNKKSLSEIAADNSNNINKVKNNSFTEDDLKGGTLTISNLGMFGVSNFTAIINQPESCILALGSIAKKPVVTGDQLVIRDIMTITASFDHRIIDGAVGAGFLKQVKELLEDPGLLSY